MPSLYIADQNSLTPAGGGCQFTSVIATAAAKKGFGVTLLSNKRFGGDWNFPDLQIRPAFSLTSDEAGWPSQREWAQGNIAYDFATATLACRLTADDHVLFGSIGAPEFFAVLDYLVDCPVRQDLPTFHLWLAFGLDEFAGSLEAFVPLIQKIKESKALSGKIRFYAGATLGDALSRIFAVTVTPASGPLDPDGGVRSVSGLGAGLDGERLAENRPRVLYVMDGDAMVVRNGASRIAHAQLQYLRDAGYRVVGLFLIHQRDEVREFEARVRRLRREISEHEFERIFIGAPGQLSADTRRQQVEREQLDFSVDSQAAAIAQYEFPSELFQHLREHKVDATLLNYAVCFPVLDRLGLADVPAICEFHDIQARQIAIYKGAAVDERDTAAELDLLRRAHALISLNAAETAFIRDNIPGVAIRTTGVFPAPSGVSAAALAGCRDLAGVVSSSGSAQDIAPDSPIDAIDLFYVSSSHRANASGLRWFLDHVFVPFLAPRGTSMVIAGSIGNAGGWPKLANVHFVGMVDNLAPLYAAAKIVVLPITEGAGGPVKTFEALAAGRATVATSIAARTLDKHNGTVIADTPADFAAAVIALLRSEPERADLGQKALLVANELCDPRHYRDAMNEAFATVLGPSALAAVTPDIAKPQPDYVEWNAAIQSANRLVRCWLDNSPFDVEAEALAALGKIAPASVEQTLRPVLAALLFDMTAPILKTDVALFRQIVLSPCKKPEAGLGLIAAAVKAAANGASEPTAIGNAQAIADASPDDPAAHYFLANTLQRAKQQPEAAIERYRTALDLGFSEFWVLLNRVSLSYAVGRVDDARGDLARLARLPPQGSSLDWRRELLIEWLMASLSAFGARCYQEALLWAQAAVDLWPDLKLAHSLAAGSLRRLGKQPAGQLRVEHGAGWRGALAALKWRIGILDRRSATQGLEPNPLFDSAWYVRQYGLGGGIDALGHYLTHGAQAGYDPHPLFDTAWYFGEYPDVAKSGINPLRHYLAYGAREGRSPHPLFDGQWYLAQYPDVVKSGDNALIHYLHIGWREGRNPNRVFSTRAYLSRYPGLAENPLVHLLQSLASPAPESGQRD